MGSFHTTYNSSDAGSSASPSPGTLFPCWLDDDDDDDDDDADDDDDDDDDDDGGGGGNVVLVYRAVNPCYSCSMISR